jgi:hypothetical protein
MTDFDAERARALACHDQDLAEADEWFAVVLREEPALLVAIQRYLQAPAEMQSPMIPLDMRKLLKRLAGLGFFVLMERRVATLTTASEEPDL